MRDFVDLIQLSLGFNQLSLALSTASISLELSMLGIIFAIFNNRPEAQLGLGGMEWSDTSSQVRK